MQICIENLGLNKLKKYNWPGNVRELEHLIERNVLLAKTNEIENFDLPSSPPTVVLEISTDKLKSMEEMEKEHIMNALQICNGKVSGAGGGGFMVFFVPTERRMELIRTLNKFKGQEVWIGNSYFHAPC